MTDNEKYAEYKHIKRWLNFADQCRDSHDEFGERVAVKHLAKRIKCLKRAMKEAK